MPIKKCYHSGRKYICKNKSSGTISIFSEQIYQPDECPNFALETVLSDKKEDVYIVIIDRNNPFTKEEKEQVINILHETEEKRKTTQLTNEEISQLLAAINSKDK